MKIIDLGPTPPKGNSLDAIVYRTRTSLSDAFGLNQDIKAQDALITQLGKGLNNRFTLIRNFRIEEQDIPIPLILIGPTGVFVIYISSIKGVFQAKNESWLVAGKNNRYEPARPNLVTRTALMTRAVEAYLKNKDQSISEPSDFLNTSENSNIQGVL